MSRRFNVDSLPKWAKDKIESIDWADDLIDDLVGLVNLKEGYCFEWDGSHVEGFRDKKDLLDMLKYEVVREEY